MLIRKKSETDILFQDHFDASSQGELVTNVLQLPPPMLMAGSIINGKSTTGYFGIRHRHDQGTRYDDVQITVRK